MPENHWGIGYLRKPAVFRYGAAAAIVAAAFLIRQQLERWSGPLPPYLTFFPAVMAAGVMLGFQAGIAATLLAGICGWLWIFEPSQLGAADYVGLGFFLVMGLLISLVAGAYQSALRRSGQQYAMLANQTRDPILFIRPDDGRIVAVNDAAVNEYGYSREEFSKLSVYQLRGEGTYEQIHFQMEQAGDKGLLFETVHLRKDKSFFPVEVSSRAADVDGERALISVVRNITARKAAEETLRASEERYRTLFTNMTEGFAIGQVSVGDGGVPDNFRFIEINDAFEAQTGLTRDAVGKPITEVLPNVEQYWIDTYGKVALTGESVRFENYNGDTDRYYDVFCYRPAPGRFAIIFRDVTGQKRAEEALRESEERFRQLADSMPQLVWTAEPDGAVDYYNRRYQEFRGIGQDVDGSWRWAPVIHPDDVAATVEAWTRSVETGSDYEIEHRVLRADGTFRWFLSRGTPVRNYQGKIVKWYGTATDVHSAKQAEQALKEADRRKDEFIAMLAHELRNPMAAISSAASVLSLANLAPERAEYAKSVLKQRVKQLSRLVDDLLDVSRIVRGKIELHKQDLDLGGIIENAVEATKGFFEERKQRFTVRIVNSLPIFGDSVRLEQVVNNLLTNAARYTDPGGDVLLTANSEDGKAVIRVKDSGRGMPASVIPRIFDLFGQADDSLNRSTGGLGVGLTIVKKLVEMHGGTVTACSEGEGKGSEFTVRLPLSQQLPIEPEGETAYFIPPGLRILIAEDHQDTAIMTAALLQHDGHVVDMVHDGRSAVVRALETKPDVILLDLGLPEVSGFDVAKQLREQGLRETLIVAVTGYGQERDLERARASGIDYHLLKPVDQSKLAAILAFRAPRSQEGAESGRYH